MLLTGTEEDLQDSGAETVAVSRSAVLAVLNLLDPLSIEVGLSQFYASV